tara:strand:+ start:1434 stop:1802 length:369 start_codon:yes stop_codon:yes gene_type:complete
MHLVGPALSMNSTRKRKTRGLTQRDRNAQKEHNEYLQSLGVDIGKSKKDFVAFYNRNDENYSEPRTSAFYSNASSIPNNGAPVEDNTDKLEVSSGYTIVPAYNKGPYMVVAKADLKEVGKRR